MLSLVYLHGPINTSFAPVLIIDGTHELAVFLQVVESGGKNIEIAVMTQKEGLRLLDEAEVEEIVAGIEAEKAAAEAAKKGPPRDQ